MRTNHIDSGFDSFFGWSHSRPGAPCKSLKPLQVKLQSDFFPSRSGSISDQVSDRFLDRFWIAPGGSKSRPRPPQDAPGGPKSRPRSPQDAPGGPKSRPRSPQDAPRAPKIATRPPKTTTRPLKIAPRWPKITPRPPKIAPRPSFYRTRIRKRNRRGFETWKLAAFRS